MGGGGVFPCRSLLSPYHSKENVYWFYKGPKFWSGTKIRRRQIRDSRVFTFFTSNRGLRSSFSNPTGVYTVYVSLCVSRIPFPLTLTVLTILNEPSTSV